MKPSTSKRTPIVVSLFAVATACLLAPVYSCAQQPATCVDWAAQSWSGTITISGLGQSRAVSGKVETVCWFFTNDKVAGISGGNQ